MGMSEIPGLILTRDIYMWSHVEGQMWCHCHNVWHGFLSPYHHHRCTQQWPPLTTSNHNNDKWWPPPTVITSTTSTHEHKQQQTPTTTLRTTNNMTTHNDNPVAARAPVPDSFIHYTRLIYSLHNNIPEFIRVHPTKPSLHTVIYFSNYDWYSMWV